MPQRNVATNFTFEQQRQEINLLAADFWTHKTGTDTAAPTYLKHDGSNAFTGQTLAVPNAFTINSNSGNGTVTISGNLDVTGTTTTVSSANLEVTDKNILIAKGSTSDAQADGAGITIDSATDITFNFVDAKDALVSSIGLEGTTFLKAPYGQFTGSGVPSGGQGVEINAPDTNTGQIISYDRANTAYKELRVKGANVSLYTGTTNALVGTFNSTGLSMESGKTISAVIATPGQPNITSLGTLTGLAVNGTNATFTNSGSCELTLTSNPANDSGVYFNNGTNNAGAITYNHSTNEFKFRINSNKEIKTSNTGHLGVGSFGTGSPLKRLHLIDSGDVGIMLQTTAAVDNNESWEITCGANPSNNADLVFQTRANDGTGGNVALRLCHDGEVLIGTSTKNTSDRFTIMDPGNAFMSIRSDQHSDGVAQFLDFIVGTNNRASGNMVGSIRAQVPAGTTAGGTLQGELSFWSNSGDNISQNMTLHADGSLTVGTATKQLGTRLTSDGNIKMTQATSNTRRIFALPGTGEYTLNSSGGCAIGFTRNSNNDDFLIFETHKQGASHAERMRITHEGYLHLGGVSQGTNKVGGTSVTGNDFDPIFKLLTQTQNSWLMQLRSDTATGPNGIFMRAGNASTNYTMYLTGTDENNKHLLVRGDGCVTKPKQPLAIIGVTENNHTPGAGNVIEFDYVDTNRGNHYDTTNHCFECPVEGDYMVMFNHARTGWVGDIALEKAASGAGYSVIRRLEMRENGRNNNGNADWQAGSYSYIIPCSSGDKLRWKVTNVYTSSNLGGAGAMLDGYNHVYYDSVTYYLLG